MRATVLVLSLLFLGACAHHGGHKGHHGHKKHGEMCKNCKGKMWEKMDADKDGKISKDEFIKFKTDHFAEMDGDKDGFVTKEEKKAFHMSKKEKMKKDGDCKDCK